ncbi:MAG: uncharacterized protein A8A55_0012 [Amphiamblys sp. WSBS2006]|nr:MAG: uncharacterized protein A8A55_0012 [Amphiamblys sp. WSBS2006]
MTEETQYSTPNTIMAIHSSEQSDSSGAGDGEDKRAGEDQSALEEKVELLKKEKFQILCLLETREKQREIAAEETRFFESQCRLAREKKRKMADENARLHSALEHEKKKHAEYKQKHSVLAKYTEEMKQEQDCTAQTFRGFRKEKSAEIARLERLSDETQADLEEKRKTEESLKKKLASQDNILEALVAENRTLRLGEAEKRAEYESQIRYKEALLQMHQKDILEAEEERKDREERRKKEDQLRLYAEKKEKDLEEERERGGKVVDALKKRIEELEEQLSLATVAANCAVGKKDKRTYPQILQENRKLENKAAVLDAECERLREWINNTKAETEYKAAEIAEERGEKAVLKRELEKHTESLAALHKNICETEKRERKLDTELDETAKENRRMAQEIKDLSQQVRALLGSSQEKHGDETETSRLITEHLVEFKTIDELQERNRELLRTIRLVSEERESDEKEMAGLRAQLAKAASSQSVDTPERKRIFEGYEKEGCKEECAVKNKAGCLELKELLQKEKELSEAKNTQAQSFIRHLQEQNETRTEDCVEARKERDSLKEDLKQKTKRIGEAEQKIEALLDDANEALQRERAVLETLAKRTEAISRLEEEKTGLAAELEETKKLAAQKSALLAELENENTEINTLVEKTRAKEKETERTFEKTLKEKAEAIAELQETNAGLAKQTEAFRRHLAAVDGKLKTLKEEREKMKQEKKETKNEMRSLQIHNEEYRARMHILTEQLDGHDLKKQMQKMADEASVLKHSLEKERGEREAFERETEGIEDELNEKEEKILELENKIKEKQSLLSTLEEKRTGTERELVEARREIEQANTRHAAALVEIDEIWTTRVEQLREKEKTHEEDTKKRSAQTEEAEKMQQDYEEMREQNETLKRENSLLSGKATDDGLHGEWVETIAAVRKEKDKALWELEETHAENERNKARIQKLEDTLAENNTLLSEQATKEHERMAEKEARRKKRKQKTKKEKTQPSKKKARIEQLEKELREKTENLGQTAEKIAALEKNAKDLAALYTKKVEILEAQNKDLQEKIEILRKIYAALEKKIKEKETLIQTLLHEHAPKQEEQKEQTKRIITIPTTARQTEEKK